MTQQPSLKQIRTAQKQAKAIKQMQRALKSKPLTKQQIKQRQQNAPRISAKQKAYRQYLIDDTRECFSHEDAIAAVKKADAKYNELVYCRDCFVHNGYFQQLHRVLSICVALYDEDTWFTNVLDQAQQALQQEPSTRDQSPNQRRALLQPILDMIDIGYAIMKGLPKDTQTQASHYSMGVQIYAYYLSFHECSHQATTGFINIASGMKWQDALKQAGIKGKEKIEAFRRQILQAALCVYRIAECDDQSIGMPVPHSISDLRHKTYKRWSVLGALANACAVAKTKYITPFENKTALSLTATFGKREAAISNRLAQVKLA